MKGSANEIAALAAKAARGAGAPPDRAAQFGQAVACHLAAGRDAALIRDAVAALPQGPILRLPLAFTRLLEGAEDGFANGEINGDAPTDLIQSYAEALPFACQCETATGGLSITITTTEPAAYEPVARLDLPDPLADHLRALAARTFVPETEASRLAGAGAGLTDND